MSKGCSGGAAKVAARQHHLGNGLEATPTGAATEVGVLSTPRVRQEHNISTSAPGARLRTPATPASHEYKPYQRTQRRARVATADSARRDLGGEVSVQVQDVHSSPTWQRRRSNDMLSAVTLSDSRAPAALERR